jgi:dihydroorotase
VATIRRARHSANNITAGVSINHLALNENDIGPYRTFFKLSPPLRSEDDRMALVEGVRDGSIDIIVSSHDPQDVDTKRYPFEEAAHGAVGLETMLSAALRLYHSEQVPLMTLLKAMTSNPAKLLGLEAGQIAKGAPADLMIFDADEPYVLNTEDLLSRSKNTAFEGARFQGRVHHTFVSGVEVFKISPEQD